MRIFRRIENRPGPERERPMMTAANIHYEIADRAHGDFCRRFTATDVLTLIETFNGVRRRVWAEQPPEFFDRAVLDADGTLVATDAQCKRGVDLSYNGTWGYHPLVISLANTAEP